MLDNRERAKGARIESRFEVVVHGEDDVDCALRFSGRDDFAIVARRFHFHDAGAGGDQMPLRRIDVTLTIGKRIVGAGRHDDGIGCAN